LQPEASINHRAKTQPVEPFSRFDRTELSHFDRTAIEQKAATD
jgi:hypothetical protein